jgi:hypothetical protein
MPLGERAWNGMSSAPRPRRSDRITWLGRAPLRASPTILLTSTGCWRSIRSSFPIGDRPGGARGEAGGGAGT